MERGDIAMKRFEYKQIQYHPWPDRPGWPPSDEDLTKLGQKGWELCATAIAPEVPMFWYYFKREVEK